jgi:UPF0716 protein FxsA
LAERQGKIVLFWKVLPVLILVEILVFVAVIGEIGFFSTLGLWLLSAMIGGWLVNKQGLAALTRAQASFEKGVLPMEEIFNSLCLFAAGALLILPGFVSDLFAFAILVPGIRSMLRIKGAPKFGLKEENLRPRDDRVIDGVYERVPERTEQISPKTYDN